MSFHRPLFRNKLFASAAYPIAFLNALTLAIPLYVGSAYLATFLDEAHIGLVFTGAAIISLPLLMIVPTFAERFGNYFSALGSAILLVVLFLFLCLPLPPLLAAGIFALYLAIARLLIFHIDIFVEDVADNTNTGARRGLFLTAFNLGILIAPVLAGAVLSHAGFRGVFLLAALFGSLVAITIAYWFRSFRDPAYEPLRFRSALSRLMTDPNLRRIAASNMLLFVFYAWTIIYLPLYLHNHIGFEWPVIGALFAIMLIPFVVVEWPLGRLADTRTGEKEWLIAGFGITALGTAALFFIEGNNFWLWALALVGTRLGASIVEIMIETYFFKHIGSRDDHMIGLFRMTQPLGHIVGPLLAVMLLSIVDIRLLFPLLGSLMLLGIPIAYRLKDTN